MNKTRMLRLCGAILLLSLTACGRKGPLFMDTVPAKATVPPAPAMQPASSPVPSPVPMNQPQSSR